MRSSRIARAALVGAAAFALVPVVGISPAHACSCAGWDEEKAFEAADVVFRGTLPEGTVTGRGGDSDPVVLTFAADRVYKGAVFAEQKVSTAASGASCGLEIAGAGPFLVFATNPREADGTKIAPERGKVPVPEASLCGGTRAVRADERPAFGEGASVDPSIAAVYAEVDPGPGPWASTLPVVYFAGGAALLALPFLLRRRRRA